MDVALMLASGRNNFHPSQIAGLRLWLDAGDVSTITKDGSERVSGWRCKAPYSLGNAVQSGGDSTKPVYSAAVGGFGGAGVSFDGAAQFLEAGASTGAYSFLHKATGGAVYVLCEYANASVSGNHPIITTATGLTGPGFHLYCNGTVLRNAIYDNSGGQISNAQGAANGFAAQKPLLFSARMSSLSGTNVDNRLYRNNETAAVAGADITSYPTHNHQGYLQIGKTYNAAIYGKIIVREVLIYEGAVSDTDHAALCRYLTAKWFKPVIGAVVMGDSNALGISTISGNLPVGYQGTFTSPYNVYVTQGTDGSSALLKEGVNNDAYDASSYGTEMSLAKELMVKYQKEVWLVKKAANGAVLYGSSNSFDVASGNQYSALKTRLNTVNNYLRFRGMIPQWKMLMCLGTNNLQNLSDAENQTAALRGMIDDLRLAMGQDIPVAITKLGTNEAVGLPPARPSGLPYIYEARIAHEALLAGCSRLYQISTDDLTYGDSSHWNPAANVTLGQRAAAVL